MTLNLSDFEMATKRKKKTEVKSWMLTSLETDISTNVPINSTGQGVPSEWVEQEKKLLGLKQLLREKAKEDEIEMSDFTLLPRRQHYRIHCCSIS